MSRPAYVTVAAVRYRVVESLGFAQSAGADAKLVETAEGERMVVRRVGEWCFWERADRLAPLLQSQPRRRGRC